jgi:hypothetical protein
MSDAWIASGIVAPLVLVAVVLLLRAGSRGDRQAADALAARRTCPACGTPSLVWAKQTWAVDVQHDDSETSASGYTFRCRGCRQAFRFTDDGSLYGTGGTT